MLTLNPLTKLKLILVKKLCHVHVSFISIIGFVNSTKKKHVFLNANSSDFLHKMYFITSPGK